MVGPVVYPDRLSQEELFQPKAAIMRLLWGPVLSSCALLILLVLFPEKNTLGQL